MNEIASASNVWRGRVSISDIIQSKTHSQFGDAVVSDADGELAYQTNADASDIDKWTICLRKLLENVLKNHWLAGLVKNYFSLGCVLCHRLLVKITSPQIWTHLRSKLVRTLHKIGCQVSLMKSLNVGHLHALFYYYYFKGGPSS